MALIKDLKDEFLIDYLKKNYNRISFLSEETKTYIRHIKPRSKQLNDIFDTSKHKSIDVLDFWERLLIDAVRYLKWHDLKEFPKRRPNSLEAAHKTISEGSLGIYNLKSFFKAFIDFEKLLYGAEKFYRDHVYHLLRVWLTGQYIIHQRFSIDFPVHVFDGKVDDKYDISTYVNDISTKHKRHQKRKLNASSKCPFLFEGEEDAIWCIAALTHDLGYPLGKIDKINENIKVMMRFFAKTKMDEFSFSFPPQNQFINNAILEYMSSKIVWNKEASQGKEIAKHEFNTHRQAKYYLKFSRSFERFDHGLISCIVLTKNLVYFLETNFDFDVLENLKGVEEARQFIIRREMLRAIASHTCHEIYHFKPNSLSFLLLFVDELQFWGRPTFQTMWSGVDKQFKIRLDDYSNKLIAFTIKCTPTRGHKPDSLGLFFKEKVDMFKKILRIAVDATDRPFVLKFKIIDETKTTYEFISKSVRHPIIKVNNRSVSYDELRKKIQKWNKT